MDNIPIKSIAELLSFRHIAVAALIVAGAWLVLKLTHWLSQRLAERFSRYRMQITGLYPLVRLLVWVGATYVILVDVFNPPQNTLLALLASTGLAVGLAAQDVIRNVISGVLILFEKPFRVGDMVRIGEHYGEILSIGLRAVQLRTFDDNVVTVPNATITGQAVANANAGTLDEMVVVSFTVPATLDVQRVKELAWDAAESSPYAYLKKPIAVIAEDVFDRTFLTRFHVKAYVLDVRLERMLATDILERIKKALVDRELLTPDLVLGVLRGNSA